MLKFTVKEYNDFDDVKNVRLKEGVKFVYLSDNDECPYVGCEYIDGTFSVVGVCVDQFCSYDDMVHYLTNF